MGHINFLFVMLQILNAVILVIWLFLVIRALQYLRTAKLSENIRLLWVAIVIFVPLIGALAVLNVRPSEQRAELS
jgi:hypothetical protein